MEVLSNRFDSALFNDTSTPQSKALEWIQDTDSAELCPNSRFLVQRYIMAVFYFSTSGDQWKSCSANDENSCQGENFLSRSHECFWGGVECNGQREIIWIHLDKNNLAGPIPFELGSLSKLEELVMDDNKLSGTIPGTLGDLTFLTMMDFDNNTLTGALPEDLFSATSLKIIDLDRNQLSGSLSTKFGDLTNLYFLQLDLNFFTGGIPSSLAGLSDLTYLSLLKTSLTEKVSSAFCDKDFTFYADCSICVPFGSEVNCCTACLNDST